MIGTCGKCGKPVLWTIAGNLDMLPRSYNTRFFNGIYCLVLTVDDDALRDQMTNGRGITDSGWIRVLLDIMSI